jgi:hypothetical protein
MALVDFAKALYAPWARRHGNDPEEGSNKHGFDNNFTRKWRNYDDDGDVEVLKVGRKDFVQLAGTGKQPSYTVKTFSLDVNALLVDHVFFIADRDYEVKAIYEVHKTKDTDSGTVTATIRRSRAAGVTIANGTALCTALSMKTTDDTVQEATLSTTAADLKIEEDDRISVDLEGVTDLAGVTIVLVLSPGHTTETAVFTMSASPADSVFFLAPMAMKIASIKYCHTVLGTHGSAVTAMVKKQNGTETSAQGDACLSASFNCKAAINTVQEGALHATAAFTRLAAGDRLSVDLTGTLTALAGVVVMVEFEPLEDRKLVTFMSPSDGAALVDQTFFIADRKYEVVYAAGVWEVASGAATNIQLLVDIAAEAAGAGTALLSNDSNNGFQSDGTAYTPEVATWLLTTNFLLKGDRLSINPSGTMTTFEGMVIVVVLKPC